MIATHTSKLFALSIVAALWLADWRAAVAADAAIRVPAISGLDVQVGDTVPIPGATNSILHQFDDGRIVVVGDAGGVWSSDGGRTWTPGPRGPDDKTTINLGGGEVLSIYRTSVKRADGKYELAMRRSTDNWKTVTPETATLDTPQATTTGGDDGGQHDGLLAHHGAIQLSDGRLMMTMYGNFRGDNIPAAGYPEELRMLKCRTVVVFSADRGRSWANPITVGYDRQLARGADPDSSVQTTATAPAVTQEGFNEADLVRAADGTIVCAMRSGGRIGIRAAPIFPTPLYVSRSKDEGKTWTPPVPIADRGVCPYLVKLNNGVIVCSYARPGSWLIFSADNGESWQGAFQFTGSDSYCNLVEVAPDKILVIYYRDGSGSDENGNGQAAQYASTYFTVKRK